MSVLERRGQTIKRVMVNLTEAAILRDAAAYAAGASSGKAWDDASANEGEVGIQTRIQRRNKNEGCHRWRWMSMGRTACSA